MYFLKGKYVYLFIHIPISRASRLCLSAAPCSDIGKANVLKLKFQCFYVRFVNSYQHKKNTLIFRVLY